MERKIKTIPKKRMKRIKEMSPYQVNYPQTKDL